MTIIHVWERLDIELNAEKTHGNPYTDVTVWVDLEGPGFSRRVYGFWDGGSMFRVRVTATEPGEWTWISGCEVARDGVDPGLSGKTGKFKAMSWTEAEKKDNPCRRGFLRASANKHAFIYADGTPFLMLGDTWWATPTYRFPWRKPDVPVRPGPDMSFQDMVQYRKNQGFNTIAMLAAHPVWANDEYPVTIKTDDEEQTVIRNAWQQAGTNSAKDMHNEGGRAFLFPGHVPGYENLVPDFDRINPAYFQAMDRKIDYLNEKGFIPFIEVARRDVSEVWKRFGGWPDSYARYIRYVFSRYHANNTLLSPIHFDWEQFSIGSREYNEPANMVVDRYGPPPFGNLVGTNSAPTSLVNFGSDEEARWLTFHQLGNWREHEYYWYLTEIFRNKSVRPAINGEPYYPGFPDDDPKTDSADAEANNRSGLYGSFLSGALGGIIYGVSGVWGGDIEPEAKYKIWDGLQYKSGDEVRHLKTFVDAAGERYVDLIPDCDQITPNKTGPAIGYIGWAFSAMTQDRSLLMAYCERYCPDPTLRGLREDTDYKVRWFDPRNGIWSDVQIRTTSPVGRIALALPDGTDDWGLCLEAMD